MRSSTGPAKANCVVGALRNGHRVVLLGPVQLAAGRTNLASGTPRLGTGDQDHLDAAALDVETGLVHQRLRHVAADRGVSALRARCPKALRKKQSRIAVVPRQQVDDAHRVDGLEHPRVGRRPRRPLHEVHRFDRRVTVVLVDLAVADEDRCSRIDGQEEAFLPCASVRCVGFGRGALPSDTHARGVWGQNSTPSPISRSISSASRFRISRTIALVCSPGIGAGRRAASGIRWNGAGWVSAGIGAANSGCTMST